MRPLVLHVTPFLWSGAGSVITRLCEHQRRSGPVAIVTTSASEGLVDWPDYRRRLRRAGVRHFTLDVFHRDAERFWSSATALAELISALRPRVIHAHAGVPSALAAIARFVSGSEARLIGQMYSWGPNRPRWMDLQDCWGLSQTDRVICSARAYERVLRKHGVRTRQVTYLPWGLPLETLPCRGFEPRREDRPGPVLGFVGRLEPRKGQLALVEAFARLRRAAPDARLELVGPVADEDYAARIRERVRQLGLDPSVHLLGHVRDPRTHVGAWDLFVSLSEDEGQGLAVLEAMALGVPVAARPVAGIADFLVDGRTGWAIPGASPAAAAAGMRRALAGAAESRAITRRARRMVERRFDWNQMLGVFSRLYWG